MARKKTGGRPSGTLRVEGLPELLSGRLEDPAAVLDEISHAGPDTATQLVQKLYAPPMQEKLIGKRIAEIKEGGGVAAVSATPMAAGKYGKLAEEAGADVIVTACPFCLVNMEDAIKVAGLEGKMEAIDLSELIAQHMQ